MREFKIPTCNVNKFNAELTKLNLRIAKKGLNTAPIEALHLGTEYVAEEINGVKTGNMFSFEVFMVEGVAPRFDGWKLIAKLTDASFLFEGQTGTVVSMVPGEPELGTEWRHTEIACEHCATNRKRRDTFLVQNEETGKILQVGRQCLKDFLGHKSPEAIAAICEMIINFFYGVGEDFVGGIREPDFFDTFEYLCWVSMAIRNNGWVSKKQAWNSYGVATADQAFTLMREKPVFGKPRVEPAVEDQERANVALAWVRDHLCSVDPDTLNDYMFKLRMTCESDRVAFKSLGICASLIPTVEREMGKIIERQSQPVSNYVGQVKERRTFELTLTHVRELESVYGVSVLYSFVDPDGNKFGWFASSRQPGLVASEEGIPVILTGTIKEHKEYKGTKQTMLTRCKIVKVGE